MSDQPATVEHLDSERHEELLVVWQSLRKIFAGWRNNLLALFDPRQSMGLVRRSLGDAISASFRLPYWDKFNATVAPLSDPEIDYLRVLAQQQFELAAASFRFNAVTSVTVPASAAVLINQFAPGQIAKAYDGPSDFWILAIVALFIFGALSLLFSGVYRSRELRMALEIEAAKRRLKRGETLSSAGGDAQDLSL